MLKEFRQCTADMTPQCLGPCWELESSGGMFIYAWWKVLAGGFSPSICHRSVGASPEQWPKTARQAEVVSVT